MPERFDIELNRTLFGRNFAETQWEVPAFSAFAEAVETVALQRGVERWTPKRIANGAHAVPEYEEPVMGNGSIKIDGEEEPVYFPLAAENALLDPDEAKKRAFVSALPIVARLAASTTFFDGFLTGNINDVSELDWIAVPPRFCKQRRFVIRIAGDSMEPLFKVGDLLAFEYHRTPRRENQIVIAADFTSGNGEYAVKRYKEHPTLWRFLSDNPSYAPVEIDKNDMPFPILGTFVGKLD
jgi:SOS-response transcriptional repressor LexA